jgi:hypothetical protein
MNLNMLVQEKVFLFVLSSRLLPSLDRGLDFAKATMDTAMGAIYFERGHPFEFYAIF